MYENVCFVCLFFRFFSDNDITVFCPLNEAICCWDHNVVPNFGSSKHFNPCLLLPYHP